MKNLCNTRIVRILNQCLGSSDLTETSQRSGRLVRKIKIRRISSESLEVVFRGYDGFVFSFTVLLKKELAVLTIPFYNDDLHEKLILGCLLREIEEMLGVSN